MQLCQDPSPPAWTRIAYASIRDTLSVLVYNIKKCGFKIKSSHCLQLLPNLSSIGTRGRACDAHRPDILVSVILGIGLLGLVLPSIRLFGGDGWIRTTALFRGEIYSLVQSTTLPRLQTWYTIRESNSSFRLERAAS